MEPTQHLECNGCFQQVATSPNDAQELRNVLGMLTIHGTNSIITWGMRIVRHWVFQKSELIAREVIFNGANRRWIVNIVEPIDDNIHILIVLCLQYHTKLIVWNVPANVCVHRMYVSNPKFSNLTPITSSLVIMHSEDECDILHLNQTKNKRYQLPEFKEFLIIKTLKNCKNHLVTLNKDKNVISIWKVTEKQCIRVSSYRSKHLMRCTSIRCLSKSVLILTLTDGKLILKLYSNNHIYSETFVKDFYYADILTNFSNSLVLVMKNQPTINNSLSEIYELRNIDKNISLEKIAGAPYGNEENICQSVYLKSIYTILVLTYDRFNLYKYTLPETLIFNIRYAEIRKNARVLSQAKRTSSSAFEYVPVEICIKIICMTGDQISGIEARRGAEKYFCRPVEEYVTSSHDIL